jgi:hypothetical protein
MTSRSKFILLLLGTAAFISALLIDVLYWEINWEFLSIGRILFTLSCLVIACFLLAFIPLKKMHYKDKLTLSVPIASTILLLLILFPIINYEFGFSDKYNYFIAKKDLKKGKIQIVSYGLQIPSGYEEEEAAIEREFGYKHIWEGCIISSKGYIRYNNLMGEYLTKKNGKGWEKRFQKKLDSLMNVKKTSQSND